MKKKFLALMLSVVVGVSMTACGGSDSDAGNGSSAAATSSAETSAQKTAEESEPETESVSAEEEDVPTEEDSGEIELIYNEANGLLIGLPSDFVSADSGVEGQAAFTNPDKTVIVTITGPIADETASPDQLTEEVFAEIVRGYGDDAAIDNVGTVEQPDGATAVAAFGTCSMSIGKMNAVIQCYFISDGSGYYVVNYLYPTDDAVTDEIITDILASVTVES